MFAKLFAVARTTFTETVRQPIYAVVVLLTWLMLIMCVAVSAFTMDDDNKLLLDMGLSTLLLSGLLLSAFCASGVISGEIEDRTVLTVVSKPISRTTWLLGKFLGLNAALLMAFYLCGLVFLFIVRHGVLQTADDSLDGPVIVFSVSAFALAVLSSGVGNYLYRWHFSSSLLRLTLPLFTLAMLLIGFIDKDWEFQSFGAEYAAHDGAGLGLLLTALGLTYLAILMISGVALAASTRLGQVMTLLICTGFFLLGLVSNYMLGRHADESTMFDLLYRLAGNLQPFWITDALTQKLEITFKYAAMAAGYGLLYTAALVALAVALFQTREVG